jgi:hypothetical protein
MEFVLFYLFVPKRYFLVVRLLTMDKVLKPSESEPSRF